MVGYMLYGLWKIGISTNGGNIKNLHQPETQKLFFFHKQTPFQNIKAHFAYLIVMMMICTRVRVRGERVRARPGVVRCGHCSHYRAAPDT